VGQVVRHTQDPGWIKDIVRSLLPAAYYGNTLEEVERMVADSIKNGFVERSPLERGRRSASSSALSAIQELDIELFHTEQQVAFAAITTPESGTTCTPIRSEAMRHLVRLRYFKTSGKTIGKDALNEVIDLLEARALYESQQQDVQVRLYGDHQLVYYDLGRSDGYVVRVTADGWTLVRDRSLRFYRPPGFVAQVDPQPGGDLIALKMLLRLDNTNWSLFLAFLVSAMKPNGPYMMLLVDGEHGSGKSFLSTVAKWILDPNSLEKIRLPREEHALAIQAAQNRVLVYDNTSAIRWDISDALCALATGSGFSTRKFYTDDESRTFKSCRPVIINGIGEFADRPDLLDRAIPLHLPSMAKGARQTEKHIEKEFEAIRPKLMGALLDAVSIALRRYNDVKPPTSIRMADAAQWLVAAEPATGLPAGTFIRALEGGLEGMMIDRAVNDPLVIAIFKLLDTSGPEREYRGSVGDLHEKLISHAERYNPRLPQTAQILSNSLQRLRQSMAKIGLMVELGRRTKKARPVHIWVEETDETPDVPDRLKRLQ
jgi:hypothetical protein